MEVGPDVSKRSVWSWRGRISGEAWDGSVEDYRVSNRADGVTCLFPRGTVVSDGVYKLREETRLVTGQHWGEGDGVTTKRTM